jgi:polyhydroxyalkanoate synthesis regulator phasin
MQWLEEMKQHEDLAVRGGVKVTTDYILRLKKQIEVLEEKNQLKDEYMRKLKDKR